MSVSGVALLLAIAVAAPIPLAAVEIEGLVYRFENGVTCHVRVVEAHPFLVDHAKVLVLTRDEILLEQLQLYPDAGAGAALHVFAGVEPPSEVILIDANGTWVRAHPEIPDRVQCGHRALDRDAKSAAIAALS